MYHASILLDGAVHCLGDLVCRTAKGACFFGARLGERDDPLSSVIDVLFDVNQIGSLKLLQHKGCVASWNA